MPDKPPAAPAVNRMQQQLACGEMVLSMSVRMSRTADIAVIAEAAGYDALFIDLQHSAPDLSETSQICVAARLAGITPIVRVPSHEPRTVGRVLDGGAQAIIFPDIDTGDEARAAAAACRFPPSGTRSMGGPAVQLGYRAMPSPDQARMLTDSTLAIVMIESAAGLANADAIAATEGVDLVLVGTNDLCADLGIHGQFGHEEIEAAYRAVAAACLAHGKHLGVGGVRNDIALLTRFVRMGARYISAGTDIGFLSAYARIQADELRRIQPAG